MSNSKLNLTIPWMVFSLARSVVIFAAILVIPDDTFAQAAPFSIRNASTEIINRLEVTTGIPFYFETSSKPLSRRAVTKYVLNLDTAANITISKKSQWDLEYIFKDNNEWLLEPELPLSIAEKKREDKYKFNIDTNHHKYYKREKPILRYFYKTPAHFFETGNEHFYLKVNPILNVGIAHGNGADGRSLFQNLRGLELRGGIDNRIFFYSNILEQQQRFPVYVDEFIEKNKAIPQNGFYKKYRSTIFDSNDSYDFLNAEAYVGFNISPHVTAQLGHGRNFIGSGYRSMLLSDFSQNYFHFKLNWRIGKFEYQNLFAELNAVSPKTTRENDLIAKKYIAAHYLTFRPTSNFSVGLFEAVILNRSSHFELNYLNPVILYRSAEGLIGGSDNVLLGINAKWNLFRSLQIYSQFILDEFKYKEWIKEDNNWWAKKYGAQIGVKYFNVANIEHFDIQAEFNKARPYTYTHRDSSGASFSHNNMSLAHPLGANFEELILLASYRPFKKVSVNVRYIIANSGEDQEGENWGGNILLPYTTREMDFGNITGQGIDTRTNLLGLKVNYQVMHNTFLYAEYLNRKKDSEISLNNLSESYIGMGLRMNIGDYALDF